MMKILFVGSGSGGHFYPLLAVAESVQSQTNDSLFYYMGPEPYDQKELDAYKMKFISCPAGKLRRYFSIQNFFDFFRTIAGFFVALWKLYIIYPDVIFSKGGYASVPVLQAARLLRIPVVIHESDAKPGLSNKLAASFARYIGIAYDDVATYFPKEKTALVGIPIRSKLLEKNPDPVSALGINPNLPLVYVTGGSLGAERLNSSVLEALPEILEDYQVFHQCGNRVKSAVLEVAQNILETEEQKKRYYLEGTLPAETVSLLLQAASVVVTRAGSTTLFEIAEHGKPAIIIPIPEAISHDQRTNAYTYASSGAGSVIEEKNLTSHLLSQEIRSIIDDSERYNRMATAAKAQALPGAANKIATALISITREHE